MKHTKIILAGILALALTACADTNTAEENTLLLETTSEAVMTEETTTATEETETTAAAESETTSAETEETTAASEETTAAAGDENDIAKVYADILMQFSDCLEVKANLIDLDSDGVQELVLTLYSMGGHDYSIYKSDGSEVQGLWNDYSLLSDYATTATEYSMQQYKNTETGGTVVIYTGCGNEMGFTYLMDAVMLPESLIAQGKMTGDYSAMEMELTVYSDGEAMGTAQAIRSRNENDNDPFWNDWDSLDEAENLYNLYFGKYEFVTDSISDLNPIKVDDKVSVFLNGECIVSPDELAELVSEIISE